MLGHALHLKGNLRAYLTEQYREHGPIFEVQAPGRKLLVLAGQDANLFMIREGTTHLRSWEQWSGFSHEVGTPRVVTGMDGADHFQLRRAMKHGNITTQLAASSSRDTPGSGRHTRTLW